MLWSAVPWLVPSVPVGIPVDAGGTAGAVWVVWSVGAGVAGLVAWGAPAVVAPCAAAGAAIRAALASIRLFNMISSWIA
jgi:hypothetical protein